MSFNNEDLNNNIERESETKGKLEKTAENLKTEIKSLEKVNLLLRNRISELEQENLKLNQNLENIELESESHSQVQDNVINLQKKLAKLATENAKLKEELNISKGQETIKEPFSRVQDFIQKRHAALESKKEEGEIWKEEVQINNIPVGKVKDLIEKRQVTLKEAETSNKFTISQEKNLNAPEIALKEVVKNNSQIERFTKQIEEITYETDENIVLETTQGRRKCPKCGNSNLKLIRETIDRTKVISVYGGLFGKKYKCGECGAEWK